MRFVGLMTLAITLAITTTVAAPAPPEADTEQASGGCTIWHESPGPIVGPEKCTVSSPWWTAWARCDITPIQSQRWEASAAGDEGPERLPWVVASPEEAGIIGHLFMGSRPLPVNHTYSDGSNAKVLWRFSEAVTDFRLTATNTWDEQGERITIVEAGPENGASHQWPSYVSVPSAGCWEVQISGVNGNGDPVKGTVTFIAIEG